ncbi:MAG: response regulator transcription factor [Nitrospirae bacterium]|nr:response regulator transcription factor [Nitrospirota bacterium]
MSAIRVMIAENDSAQMQSLCTALDRQDSMDIISTVSSRETAIKHLTASPDIMLLNSDVLKDYPLSRFMHSIHAKSPQTRIIYMLQQTPSDDELISDIRTGVRGYFKTTDLPAFMIKAIHCVFDGGIWAERRVLEKTISNPLLLTESIQAHLPGLPALTNREREMLAQVLKGASNKEIAVSSSISERTVKTHLYRVYRKLNVKSRTKAIALLSQS